MRMHHLHDVRFRNNVMTNEPRTILNEIVHIGTTAPDPSGKTTPLD